MRTGIAALTGIVLIVLSVVGYVYLHPAAEKNPEPQIKKVEAGPSREKIGESVEHRAIESVSFGHGPKHVVFVGGIHGGYEWNSVLLSYQLIDYLTSKETSIPSSLTVTVIPDANPDAVYKAIGKEGVFSESDVPKDKDLSSERFNAHAVDLNRNFDCKWQPKATWREKAVSAGSAAFSEPEAAALRDYFKKTTPAAVVFYHSQANAVYASQCEKGILPATLDLMNRYAAATKYSAVKEFTAYPTTGAAEDWLASIGIPAISVELSTHDSVEWERNLPGIEALLSHFAAT